MKKLIVFLMLSFGYSLCFGQDTTRLSLLFLGDIMQHDSQISDAYDPVTKKYNYEPCFQFIKPYVESADLAIGNLELTLAGPPYKGYPQFSAPDGLLFGLKNMGVDVLVTANNHCVDTGQKGLERTIMMLDSLDIPHTGTFVDEVDKLNNHPLIVRKNGLTLALLNYTFSTNGLPVTAPNIVNRIDTALMRSDLAKARAINTDAIIVFTHWGVEYESLPNAWQKQVTEFCFRHGAKLVIGAHPHVLQPMEWRRESDQLVAYSLGNFVSGQRKRYTDGGALITLDLEKIELKPDSSRTTIQDPKYILEWVYRTVDHEKNYFVLPVNRFEQDTTGFIADAESKTAFKLYAQDSRGLYSRHNIGVPEDTTILADTIFTYRILLPNLDPGKIEVLSKLLPAGIDRQQARAEVINFFSGEFVRLSEAERYLRRVRGMVEFGSATIVRFPH